MLLYGCDHELNATVAEESHGYNEMCYMEDDADDDDDDEEEEEEEEEEANKEHPMHHCSTIISGWAVGAGVIMKIANILHNMLIKSIIYNCMCILCVALYS